MRLNYPNLELLEYKARQLLSEDESFKEVLARKQGRNKYRHEEYVAHVFPQLWGSTCLGFDILEDNSLAISGCAMTSAYTTVFHEVTTDTWVVFFGNNPCYKVTDANEEFLHDLAAQSMASLSEAKKRY